MVESAEQRFVGVYEAHRGAVMLYLRRRVRPEVVEDLLAETFLVCWRRLDEVPREPLPWLYAVARNTLANHRRAEARANAAPPIEPAEDAYAAVAGDDVLARAFALLGEDDRELLALIAWERVPLAKAAQVIGCSGVACRVRFHRARRRLATQLARFEAPVAFDQNPNPRGATS